MHELTTIHIFCDAVARETHLLHISKIVSREFKLALANTCFASLKSIRVL